jgi:hypothetical protein
MTLRIEPLSRIPMIPRIVKPGPETRKTPGATTELPPITLPSTITISPG